MATAATPSDIDRVRHALRNPKKFLEWRHIANPRQAQEFIYQSFGRCPLFYFDKELSAQAAKLGADYPDVMGRLMPDVRLPFVNIITVHTVWPDEKLAYNLLWESKTRIRSQLLIGARIDGTVERLSVAPFSYIIYPDGEKPGHTSTELHYGSLMYHQYPPKQKGEVSDDEFNITYAACHMLGRSHDERHNLALLRHFEMCEPLGGLNKYGSSKVGIYLTDRAIAANMKQCRGHLREVAALLIMLNMRDYVTRVTEQPRQPGSYRYRRVSVPYMTTRVVTLIIPEPKVVRALKKRASEIALRRRHSVRGHWMIRTTRPTCIHLFTKVDENHMHCGRCEGVRYWRKAHERGDASLGYVRHEEYKVEHSARSLNR